MTLWLMLQKCILTLRDHEAILNFVQEIIQWVVVGPEQPLIDGLPDKLRQTGVKVFGPNKGCKLKDLSYSLKNYV